MSAAVASSCHAVGWPHPSRRQQGTAWTARRVTSAAAVAAALWAASCAHAAAGEGFLGAAPPGAARHATRPRGAASAVARKQQPEHGGCPVDVLVEAQAASGAPPREVASSRVMHSGVTIDVVQAALSDGVPLVVDFMAPRCSACRRLDGVLNMFEEHFKGRVRVVKVDVLQHKHFLEQLDFRRVPAVFLFDAVSGELVDSFIGKKARPLDIFESIEGNLLA